MLNIARKHEASEEFFGTSGVRPYHVAVIRMNKWRVWLRSHRGRERRVAFRSKFYDSSARQLFFRATSLSPAANIGLRLRQYTRIFEQVTTRPVENFNVSRGETTNIRYYPREKENIERENAILVVFRFRGNNLLPQIVDFHGATSSRYDVKKRVS